MDTKELQKKSTTELEAHVSGKRDELRKLRFSAAGSGMRDAKAQRNTRKDIARALTELHTRARKESNDASNV